MSRTKATNTKKEVNPKKVHKVKKAKHAKARKTARTTRTAQKKTYRKKIVGKGSQSYFYVPVTKGGQLILNSIDTIHILQFIDCLSHSQQLQNWFFKHKASILRFSNARTVKKRIFPFFKTSISPTSVLNSLDANFQQFLVRFMSLIHDESGKHHKSKDTVIVNNVMNRQLVPPLKGGTKGIIDTMVNFISSGLVILASSSIDSTPNEPRRTIQVYDSDPRRAIIGICFPDVGFKCMAKCSNNDLYIDGYKKEAKVYTFFESMKQKEDFICRFYGGVVGRGTIENNDNISVSFPIPVVNTSVSITIPKEDISFEGKSQERLPAFYSLLTQWDEKYTTLREALAVGMLSTIKRNRYLTNVMRVTGYLNEKYGFFHGDLKDDNIMVSKDGFDVRCFDFDWSGIITIIPNNTVLSYFNRKRVFVRRYLKTNNRNSRIFFLIFDAYRLFVSWIWELSKRSKRFDVFYVKCRDGTCINSIEIKNNDISFTLQDIIDYLITFTTSKTQRNIDFVIKVIEQKYRLNTLDWNRTLMHENVIFNLVQFIGERRLKK